MTEIEREDRVIIFQVAKLAKEKNFNWGTNGCFIENHDGAENNKGESTAGTVGLGLDLSDFMVNNMHPIDFSNEYYTYYAAPSKEMLTTWLREEHKLIVNVVYAVQAPYHDEFGYLTVEGDKGFSVRVDDLDEEHGVRPEHFHVTNTDERDLFDDYNLAWNKGLKKALELIVVV